MRRTAHRAACGDSVGPGDYVRVWCNRIGPSQPPECLSAVFVNECTGIASHTPRGKKEPAQATTKFLSESPGEGTTTRATGLTQPFAALSNWRSFTISRGGTHSAVGEMMSETDRATQISEPKRVRYLDAIRGAASFLVVVGHAHGYSGLTPLSDFLPIDLGRAGIIAFFIVSGYVVGLSLAHQTPKTFWIRRVFRLFPSYWLCLILFIAINWPIWNGRYEFDAVTIALNILMIQGFVGGISILWPTWTLGSELVFYAQQSVLKKWFSPSLSVHLGWAWLALFGVMAFLTRFTTHDYSAIAPLVLFTASVGLAVYLKDSVDSKVWIPFVIGFVVVVPALGWVLHGSFEANPSPWTVEIFDWSYLAGGALFMAFYLLREKTMPRLLLWLGDVSYALYLIHAVVMLALARLGVTGWALVVLTAALSLAFSYVIHRWLEQPLITVGRSLTKRKVTAATIST
jgi:peptidoglycan/LPS O-acetylase OafA/YrhL